MTRILHVLSICFGMLSCSITLNGPSIGLIFPSATAFMFRSSLTFPRNQRIVLKEALTAQESPTVNNHRLAYSADGYDTWKWTTFHGVGTHSQKSKQQEVNGDSSPGERITHSINYLEMGDSSSPALLLIHGFGASSYHWRHNIPILARNYHVYALDLLGFGWSDKPIMNYDVAVWRDQVVDFVTQVIWKNESTMITGGRDDSSLNVLNYRPITIAGNSLGGYTAMFSAVDVRIKEYVKGCILLNAAGKFRDSGAVITDEVETPTNPIIESISSAIQRVVISLSFIYTKQPARIEQILRNVYPVNSRNVDAELVQSIQTPSLDANAAEVFYRVITKTGSGKQLYVDDIISKLECPVLLAWGEEDPWIRSAAADKIERLHAEFHGPSDSFTIDTKSNWIKRVSINAGHCPHDEAPDEVNKAMLEFMREVFQR